MFRYRISQTGILVAMAFAGSVQAQGNISFGNAPALPYGVSSSAQQNANGVPGALAPVHQPGVNRAIMPPVSPEESEKAIWGRTPGQLNVGVQPVTPPGKGRRQGMRVSGDTAPLAPASIAELARALRGNPDLIYEYVRNNIEYVPAWGLLKGDYGTVLDNQGSAFDQAALMVALLRQSGYTASFVKGRINMTAAQLKDWMGIEPSNVCAVLNLLGSAQIPTSSVVATAAGSCPGSTAALVSLKLDHVWVKVNIGGVNYYFDPSYKPHTVKTGVNLASATGYNATTFMSAATSGATITADYVQGINRTSVRNNLSSYASNLASYLRANLPAGTLDDVIGGMQIVPHDGAALRQSALPYQDTSVALTEWTDVPANYKPTLRVQYQGIDRTFTSDAIYGRRLTLTYNASSQPVLSLDGVALATGTAVTPGTYGNVSFTVTHGAYASTFANQAFTQQIKSGGTFLIGNAWGPSGRGPIEVHRSSLNEALASGAAAGSEAVLGSTLAILSSSWIGQTNHSGYITDRLARTNTIYHHQVGIAGYNTAAYVDLPGNMLSVVSQQANRDKEAAAFFSSAMHSSIMESTAVQQTTGGSAVSTVKLIDQAVTSNDKIYDAKSSNFSSAVQPNLVGCASWMSSFQSAVSAGRRLILPARCNLTEGSWTGTGYYSVLSSASSYSLGAIIGGGLAGGFSTSPMPATTTSSNTFVNSVSPSSLLPYTGSTFGDPIDMTKGHFLYSHTDLTSGDGEFPLSLNFTRLYASAARTQSGPMGNGWTHNLASGIGTGSDGFQGMGEDSGLDAVGAIAEKMVSLDLLTDNTKPVANMVIATLGQRWFGEQVTDNTVVVKQGVNGELFVRLPDGTFNSAPGSSSKLTKNGDGTYSYETVNKALLNFDTGGKLATYTHPAGVQVRYTYSGGLLTQVANSLGRTLTLTNVSGRIASVSDGTRSVGFTYDGRGDLTTYKDPLSQNTTYQYDLPGRMTKLFYPANPSVADVSNVYDSLGRVQTQTNASGKLYTYYFAGSRSEEVGPYAQSRVSYVDAQGKVLKAIDPLGRVTTNTYDGQSRLVKSVAPEGNRTEYEYDDAPCAAQLRCTHNVKTVRQVPKAGSPLPALAESYVYESVFNKLARSTDPMLQATDYTYTSFGQPLSVSAPADAQGVRPTTTYGYTAFSPAGFPQFYLQTSMTSKISASTSVTNTTSYDTANKFVRQSLTEDAGGLNLVTTYTYDAVGNVTQVNGPRSDVNDITNYTYNAQRQPLVMTDALGKSVKNFYDADGRVVRIARQTGTQWLVTCHSYTVAGKVARSWGPALTASDTVCPTAAAPVPVTDYVYDDLNRPTRVTANLTVAEGGNRVSETTYYADDSIQSISRAVGSANAQVYARYTYTPNGRVATIADAKNNLTTYQYDGLDRKVKTQYPDKNVAGVSSATDVEQFSYNSNGNLTSMVKRNGQTVTVGYDNLGRVVSRSYPDAADNVTFSYDLLSRQLSARYANGSHDIVSTFDNAGRVASVSAGGKVLSYQYDAAGNRIRTTWPEATPFYVTTDFDALNRPLSIKEMGTANLATYGYDDLSRRVTVTFGNGTSSASTFTPQSALAGLSHDLAGTTHDVAWTYNRNQIQEVASYSWNNDIYQWTGYTNGTRNYTANGLDQYTAVAGSAVSHDANGNLTGDGVWTYVYDTDNRLRSANRSGLAATLAYDPIGRLRQTMIAGVTSNFLYAGTQLVAEYDGAGNLQRRYVHGPGVDEPLVKYEGSGTGSKSWLYADNQGSVIAMADAAGTPVAAYTYGPFGETSGAGTRFGYTGQRYFGDLGLTYYKARFYSPALGRFLQTDPVGNLDSLNQYAYVGNNPANKSDPTGMVVETAWDVLNLTMGAASLYSNVRQGSWGWAAVDAVGLVYDGIATAVPFLPAGASAGLKAYRGGATLRNAVHVGSDVAEVANKANQIARNASTAGNAATAGTRIHRQTAEAVDLSSSARNYLAGANRATGRQPDISWSTVPGLWADLTTPGSWAAHVSKYSTQFGEGIPLLYQRGVGIVNTTQLRTGAGILAGTSEYISGGFCEK